jgi:hypothetical protein
MKTIKFTAMVQKFPGKGGWIYVDIPAAKLTKDMPKASGFNLVPISVTVGKNTWKTSILPNPSAKLRGAGNSGKFIALKAMVRKKEKIEVGDKIGVSFQFFA